MRTTHLLISALIAIVSATSMYAMADVLGMDKGKSASRNTAYQGCAELKTEDSTALDIISQMIAEKRPFGALAFIESAKFKSPRLDLLKANSLFQIGKYTEAEKVYDSLKTTCIAAFAYQGLGLISSKLHRYAGAVTQLEQAARLMPIDSTIRGDYGYALMQNGNDEAAKNEFLTAVELDPKNQLAKNNLVLLLYRSGQAGRAAELARVFGLSSAEEQSIIQQSKTMPMRNEDHPLVIGGGCQSNQDICTGILSPQLESLTNETPD